MSEGEKRSSSIVFLPPNRLTYTHLLHMLCSEGHWLELRNEECNTETLPSQREKEKIQKQQGLAD